MVIEHFISKYEVDIMSSLAIDDCLKLSNLSIGDLCKGILERIFCQVAARLSSPNGIWIPTSECP
jgi:hypothetical protein